MSNQTLIATAISKPARTPKLFEHEGYFIFEVKYNDADIEYIAAESSEAALNCFVNEVIGYYDERDDTAITLSIKPMSVSKVNRVKIIGPMDIYETREVSVKKEFMRALKELRRQLSYFVLGL